MKQSNAADKYNIAWFKLAEYVSRGEKERALGIYRLLSHSIDDRAFARQLEGDILLSFNDTQAAEKYFQAAQLYREDHRMLQAAAVYEHLATLMPDSQVYLEDLVELYSQLQIKAKIVVYGTRLFECLVEQGALVQAYELLDKIENSGLTEPQFYEQLLFAMLKKKEIDPYVLNNQLKKTIKLYKKNNSFSSMDQLISFLKAHAPEYSALAIEHANQIDE